MPRMTEDEFLAAHGGAATLSGRVSEADFLASHGGTPDGESISSALGSPFRALMDAVPEPSKPDWVTQEEWDSLNADGRGFVLSAKPVVPKFQMVAGGEYKENPEYAAHRAAEIGPPPTLPENPTDQQIWEYTAAKEKWLSKQGVDIYQYNLGLGAEAEAKQSTDAANSFAVQTAKGALRAPARIVGGAIGSLLSELGVDAATEAMDEMRAADVSQAARRAYLNGDSKLKNTVQQGADMIGAAVGLGLLGGGTLAGLAVTTGTTTAFNGISDARARGEDALSAYVQGTTHGIIDAAWTIVGGKIFGAGLAQMVGEKGAGVVGKYLQAAANKFKLPTWPARVAGGTGGQAIQAIGQSASHYLVGVANGEHPFDRDEFVAAMQSQIAPAMVAGAAGSAIHSFTNKMGDVFRSRFEDLEAHHAGLRNFADNPSRRTARAAGVDGDFPSKWARETLAEKIRTAKPTTIDIDTFREQLSRASQTPQEAEALYGLIEARAESAGVSIDDYVGKRISAIEKGSQSKSEAIKQGSAINPRGEIQFLQDGRAIIRAFEEAQNPTTLAHELGHLFRRDLAGDDAETAAKWAGVKRGKAWDVRAEEKFARGFERYLRDGVAPTPKLAKVFAHFKDWMSRVYAKLKGSPINIGIPDEMRAVYDRLFTPPEAPVDAVPPVQAQTAVHAAPEAPGGDTLRQGRGYGVTSLKNAQVDAERVERGQEPIMAVARQSNQEAWDAAMSRIERDPKWQANLLTELKAKPRAATPEENAGLLHERITLRNEYMAAMEDWQKAQQAGDLTAEAEADARVQAASAELSDFEDVTKAVGTKSGQSLQARKMMADEDYSLVKMELETKQAKGRDLTPEERTELVDKKKKLDELSAKADAVDAEQDAKGASAAVDEAMKETGRKSKKKTPDPEAQKDSALGAIKAKIDKNAAAEISSDVQKLARYFWQKGIREREPMIDALHEAISPFMGKDWTREQTQRAFSGYGQFSPLSKDEVSVGLRDLKGQTQQVLKIEALENKKPLEKTGQERRVPTDAERRLIQQVNELKRRFGVTTTDPATQLKSALDARKTYYKNRLADLKYEIEQKQRIVKGQSPSPSDAELESLKAEYAKVQAEHDDAFGTHDMPVDEQLKRALKGAEQSEKAWNEKLARAQKGDFSSVTGEKFTPHSRQGKYALDLIKSRIDEAKAAYQELFNLANPKKSPEQIALQSLKTRMANEAVKLREKLAKGDFTPKPRNQITLDEEGAGLKADLELARREYREGLATDRWKRMNLWEKTKASGPDAYDLARTIMTTGEFSFVGRQGKWLAAGNPIKAAAALRASFRAFANEKTAATVEQQMVNHPLYEEALQDGLPLVEADASLHRQEEIFSGRLVGKVPGIKNFERASRTFLNKLRFDIYLAMRKSLATDPNGRKQIAQYIGEATGRGTLPKWANPAAVPLSRILFSPRYWISRFQLLSGHTLLGGSMASRKVIAQQYARSIIGMGLYATLLGWYFGDKKNPLDRSAKSSDFGKVVVGDTRIDPMAGLSQALVFAMRTASGESVNSRGEVQDLRQPKYGGRTWYDVAADYGRGKLHPVPAAFVNWLDGRDMSGNQTSLGGEALNLSAPITWGDVYHAFKEHGLSDGMAMGLLAMFGEGIQDYNKPSNKPSTGGFRF